MRQLRITDIRSPECPFVYRLEDDDFHCESACINAYGYDLIGEDSKDFALRLAEVNGVDFKDIDIQNPANPSMPRYIATIPRGSGLLFKKYKPNIVAVSLKDIISAKRLIVTKDIHKKLGVSSGTKIVLQGFSKDRLLELVWVRPDRQRILKELTSINLYLVIPPNFSIWDDQPHAERLINQKRSLLMYQEMLEMGLPVIPHIYWCGRKDLNEHIKLLNSNPSIRTIAIDLQTLRNSYDWERAMADLLYMTANVASDMKYVITGPSKLDRIKDIMHIIPEVTIINGVTAHSALHRRLLDRELYKSLQLKMEKSELFKSNCVAMRTVIDKLAALKDSESFRLARD